jgi:predicted dehydrogenase
MEIRLLTTFLAVACCVAASLLLAVPASAADASPPELAIVGCAHIHTPDFVNRLKARHDVKVKYVWDHDAARARMTAEKVGAAVVEDLNQIWNDPAIKAVVICSETNRHLELVTAAAKVKKHIYAEKPLGMGAKDGYAMADAIHEAGVLFQTGYFMRGDPKVLFVKEQVEQGNFGKITRIRSSTTHSGALGGWFDKEWRWMADPKQSGVGAYGDLGTHSLDLMLWLMNEPVIRGTATTSMGTARYEGCDELGEGIIVFKSGTIGTMAAGWDDVANPVTLEIAGTEGHATIVNDTLYFQSKKVKGADGKQPWTQLPAAWTHPFERFIDAVAGKPNAALMTAAEAAYRCAVMDALYEGAKGQKWAAVQQPAQ